MSNVTDIDLQISNDIADTSFIFRILNKSKMLQTNGFRKLHYNYAHLPSPHQRFSEEKKSEEDFDMKAVKTNKCSCNQILLADDDPFNLIVLEGLINLYDVKVDKVCDGQALIDELLANSIKKCFNHKPYTLVILDNQMPYLTGI